MAEPTPKPAFQVGNEFRIGIADPLPGKPDNIVTLKARIVSREWGGDNYNRLSLRRQWFYRLQIDGHKPIELSETELQERIR